MINYYDNEPHTATVKEHAEQLMHELREFCSTHNNYKDYLDESDMLREFGEMLEALYNRNENDIVTLTWCDWAGFNTQDEE